MKAVYIILGFISIGIGVLGIVVPGLPATSFFILSSICFFKGSDKLYNQFIETNLYKKHVKTFIETRSMKKSEKIRILMIITVCISISILLIESIVIKGILVLILIWEFYYFIKRIKTI